MRRKMKQVVYSVGIVIVLLFGFAGISRSEGYDVPPLPPLNERIKQLESSIGKKVRNIPLVNQDGKTFFLHQWMDKPLLLQLIYTKCQDTCPLIAGQLGNLAEQAGDDLGKKFRILSVTFDVDTDTPETLKAFGKQFTSNFENWAFAAGKKEDIQALMEDLGVQVGKQDDGDFQHLNFITLLNPGGVVVAHVLGQEFEMDGLLEVLTAPGGIDLVPGVY
jgi:protein SCO1/2